MKIRILNFHVYATHDSLTSFGSIREVTSISDSDAFIYDSRAVVSAAGYSGNDLTRHQSEIADLLWKKGGIVICILRPEARTVPLLAQVDGRLQSLVPAGLREGVGSQLRVLNTAKTVSSAYFQILKGTLEFSVYFDRPDEEIISLGGTVLAVNSVGHPIAVELAVGEGRICFLPPSIGASPERVGAALVRVITAHFAKTAEIEAPAWVGGVTVPGANIHNDQISDLEVQSENIEAKIANLKADRQALLDHVRLLFTYGKGVLEPSVRSAFRLFNFEVPEPEDYVGEWDVQLREAQTGRTALGEVEGSEGAIDVNKYRQLLDYIDTEAQEGRNHKGMLIGNGFRLLAPDAPERQKQFSVHAQRGASRNKFCLVPTTEVFKAVSAVLASPDDDVLKASIRESLLSTTGQWFYGTKDTTLAQPEQLTGKLVAQNGDQVKIA